MIDDLSCRCSWEWLTPRGDEPLLLPDILDFISSLINTAKNLRDRALLRPPMTVAALEFALTRSHDQGLHDT